MYYVLNHTNGTFSGFTFPEQVDTEINRLLTSGNQVCIHDIEIINASDESCRMSVSEFRDKWM